ncbi:MAG TPA: SgcJ/EcaC family oxidoreductase [Alphaproteobacteria bacterium]|jgi:uncharacterized protein (TIGR02246 family)
MDRDNAAKQAILRLIDALAAAWNAHDAKAYAASFAEDVDYTNVFGILVQCRAGVERSHAALFKTMFKDSRWTEAETSIRFVRPDVAAVDVRWQMIGARDAQGKEWPARHGLLSAIATETPEGWAFAVFHNQDLPPPERLAEITKAMSREPGAQR